VLTVSFEAFIFQLPATIVWRINTYLIIEIEQCYSCWFIVYACR
jgi:hypothetical protein